MAADQPPSARSVKISDDERGGWSSDRPRREGAPSRPADISTRCRVLRPSDRMRYSPGSLVVVVSGSADERERFVGRVFEEKNAVLSLAKVRALVAGRVPDEDIEARSEELLSAAVGKRLQAGESVVLVADTIGPEEREQWARLAAGLRRPRHLILIETGKDQVAEEDRPVLNDLRRALDAGELGEEGFQTAMRLGGASIAELKRIVFRPPPRED
jgi:predicted kinase